MAGKFRFANVRDEMGRRRLPRFVAGAINDCTAVVRYGENARVSAVPFGFEIITLRLWCKGGGERSRRNSRDYYGRSEPSERLSGFGSALDFAYVFYENYLLTGRRYFR